MRPFLRKRSTRGAMNNQFKVLFKQSDNEFKSFMRLTKSQFNQVLDLIKNDISSDGSISREGILAKEKLVVTLRHLAGGESHKTLSLYFMIGRPTISKFIPKVLQAIIRRMGPLYSKIPNTASEWVDIERRFANRWDYLNTVGAIDGKHVMMMKPRTPGSTFYNYKHTFSINLMAIAGTDYKFLAYDIGSPGRMSDSGVWNRSMLRPLFTPSATNNPLNIPSPNVLVNPASNKADPKMQAIDYHLVGDDGFGVNVNLMKPYSDKGIRPSQLIFNYRLSRARQVIEVAFGILANRFRCLLNRIHCCPRNARLIAEAAVILHNFIIYHKPISDTEAKKAKDIWYQKLEQIKERNYQIPTDSASNMRDYLREYFISEYPIESQYNVL